MRAPADTGGSAGAGITPAARTARRRPRQVDRVQRIVRGAAGRDVVGLLPEAGGAQAGGETRRAVGGPDRESTVRPQGTADLGYTAAA